MKKITAISHSFRDRDQFYGLLTVRRVFQILNAKDHSNRVESLYRALGFLYLSQAHTTAVWLLAASLSFPCPGSPHKQVLGVPSYLKLTPSL